MENTNTFKVQSTSSNLISLNVTPGHYATSSSHINYYIDMTSLKSRRSEAHAAAKVLAARYAATTIIDTIVCLDGTNVIGAYLADELLNTYIYDSCHNNGFCLLTRWCKPFFHKQHIESLFFLFFHILILLLLRSSQADFPHRSSLQHITPGSIPVGHSVVGLHRSETYNYPDSYDRQGT